MLQNRIDRITVRNFRSLKEVSVELGDLTVLVGPNGSGKSNFVDVLNLIRDALKMGLQQAIFPTRASMPHTLHFSHSATTDYDALDDIEIEILLTLGDVQGIFSFALHSTKSLTYGVKREFYQLGSARFIRRDGIVEPDTLAGIAVQEENFTLPLIGGLPEFAPLYNHLENMQFHSIFQPEFSFWESWGARSLNEGARSHLYTVLAELDEKSRAEIGDILASIVPGISREDPIVIEPFGEGHHLVKMRHEVGTFFLQQESDGTLRLLALLTALYQRPAPTLMAIEEPELLIHPPATSYLTEFMDEASLRGQVIVSTHSPDFIARFPPESLRVFEMVDGATQISPLREDQIDTINEGIFDGGELLRIQGLKRG